MSPPALDPQLLLTTSGAVLQFSREPSGVVGHANHSPHFRMSVSDAEPVLEKACAGHRPIIQQVINR